jgi:lipopolysaccharide biosynthesis regulator YciM
MVFEFVRVSNKGIFNKHTGLKSTENEIKQLTRMGHLVSYSEAKSGKDLLPALTGDYSVMKYLGPEHPEASKSYPCQRCGRQSHNRFNCPTCWNILIDQDTKDLSEAS